MQEEGGAADKRIEVSLRLSQSRMQMAVKVDETEGVRCWLESPVRCCQPE
jgi:hypothetical protein